MIHATHLGQLNAKQLRETVLSLMGTMASQQTEIERKDREIAFRQAFIDKLTHEMAVLKRLKFAGQVRGLRHRTKEPARRDHRHRSGRSGRRDRASPAITTRPRRQTKAKEPATAPEPAAPGDPHEPENTTCACGCQLKRIGQDVPEKLDYQPGVFTVEPHIRGKWLCVKCEILIQAPVPAHIIDKGIPTSGLLAQVLVAKYADHLPLYRQESIFARAGLAPPRSTLAQWVGQCGVQLQPLVDALRAEPLRHSVLHADETPVAMLKPGNHKTHRAYLWSYCTTTYNPTRAVVFDFADSRGGQHARDFLGLPAEHGWHDKLVCDDCSATRPASRWA